MLAVHLQGMGVYGCMMAWQLRRHEIPFTWEDNDQKICAWRASTGAIYPSGSAYDEKNYMTWVEWAETPPWPFPSLVERTAWWYCTKAAPHGAKYKVAVDIGALRMGSMPSFHFNAQAFVESTRQALEGLRMSRPRGSLLVISHGFNQRLDRVLWGWTSHVRLEFSKEMLGYNPQGIRPTVYLREGRFIMAYAFAVPGTPYWYAGSSLITQKTPKSLKAEPKFELWRKNFERLAGGHVKVVSAGKCIEGWRPAAKKGDDALACYMNDAVVMKPLWNSGIRHSPSVVAETIRLIEQA